MEQDERKIVYDAMRYLDRLNCRLTVAIVIITCCLAICFATTVTAMTYYYFTTDYTYGMQVNMRGEHNVQETNETN